MSTLKSEADSLLAFLEELNKKTIEKLKIYQGTSTKPDCTEAQLSLILKSLADEWRNGYALISKYGKTIDKVRISD